MTRHVSLGHDCRVDNPFEDLRGQTRSIKIQVPIFSDLAAPHRFNSCFHAPFRSSQRFADKADFLFSFNLSLRPEWIRLGIDLDAQIPETIGEAKRKS